MGPAVLRPARYPYWNGIIKESSAVARQFHRDFIWETGPGVFRVFIPANVEYPLGCPQDSGSSALTQRSIERSLLNMCGRESEEGSMVRFGRGAPAEFEVKRAANRWSESIDCNRQLYVSP
eukprot:6490812-Amphidinium_carterae.2